MKRRTALFIVTGLAAFCLTSTPGRADESNAQLSSGQLSPERLDVLDKLGYFTPGFKAAVHDLVDSKQALDQANAEQAKLNNDLPSLQDQASQADAKTNALRQELAREEHPEETDFEALQKRMSDPGARLEDRIVLAQAYVWTYPVSPHQSEAQQYLQQIQKKLADQQQAEKDSEAARAAARAKLIQRAQAHDLSLSEWRDFLRDMSQDDLVKLFGRPSSIAPAGDYWIYSGAWTLDPATNQKVGLMINFNGGRVMSVVKAPQSQ